MSKQIQLPFAGLKFTGKDVVNAPVVVVKKRKPYKRNIPSVPFVLQAFDGVKWKLIRKDGNVICTKVEPKLRATEFAKCLRDGGFIRQMKIQVFGKGANAIGDKQFFKTPVRWRRIDAVSFAGGSYANTLGKL